MRGGIQRNAGYLFLSYSRFQKYLPTVLAKRVIPVPGALLTGFRKRMTGLIFNCIFSDDYPGLLYQRGLGRTAAEINPQ